MVVRHGQLFTPAAQAERKMMQSGAKWAARSEQKLPVILAPSYPERVQNPNGNS